MKLELLGNLLSRLNRKAFSEFVYELWKLKHFPDEVDGFEIKRLQNNLFEEHYWKKMKYQGYGFIYPFFLPIELFKNSLEIDIAEPQLFNNLIEYNRIYNDRISSWQWWTDGDLNMLTLQFATNFIGISKNDYFKWIIPKFESLVKKANIDAMVSVGSCDSFIEKARDNTIKALQNFIKKNKDEIVITLGEDRIYVDRCTTEKYLVSGVLKESNDPCEPVYVKKVDERDETIKEFEYLINRDSKEKELENFLKEYYKVIFGYQYDRVETQIWLKFPELDIANKNREFDVFLRNSIEKDWELYELKRINKKLTRTYRDIPTFIAEIYQAIQQTKNYKQILLQDEVKRKFAKEGIEYYYPSMRLVIGPKPDIPLVQWRWLKTSNSDVVKIFTYYDLLEEMKLRLDSQVELLNQIK